jgi:tRNA(His) 5'-end guanylyltransferase
MCVPSVFIRDDGKGFVVRRAGVDFHVWEDQRFLRAWCANATETPEHSGEGHTIMEAVDNALSKLRAAEINEASIQEGEKE